MGFSLIPKEEKFFELFESQAAHSVEAAKVFKALVSRWDLESPAFERLRDIEHEADITTHEIIDKLNRTFVTPFDREDIHALASELDDVVDLIQAVSIRMRLYRVGHSTEELVQLADVLCQSTENLRKAVLSMKDLEKSRRILDYCIEINRLENAGDQIYTQAIGKLFLGTPDPLEVMKWKEIYEITEETMDKCEDVANIIESIIVKQG
ncbi:MAG: hypothetical protein A2X36_10165 [Elusimicrobia bacterium GWA2_69_24]|nr:MAG: hypothetical protein A2X36_10165 [Elusimicrobia bacterium GWA2_69_24]HBL19202.1 DUF47 domain-containing protein [Elusimicrobiota bacterium]